MANSRLQLLVLSNGHGEDIIAVRIIQALQTLSSPPDIFVLPIVGEGHAYQKINVPIIGKVQNMPSGGFVYMDSKELMRDVSGGLIQLTWNQIKSVRRWVRLQTSLGNQKAILAVGDIVPLLFAATSGANYAFVGTAKSEYYVRDEAGLLPRKSKSAKWENFSGSIYHPWERWLMSRSRCQAVFPRDSLTTKILKKWSIPAVDAGNPMMDGLKTNFSSPGFDRGNAEHKEQIRPLIPNSLFSGAGTMIFLGAIAPGLDCGILSQSLHIQGWRLCDQSPLQIPDPDSLTFKQKNAYLILTQAAYNECLHWGDLAIAMAGTATEQFIGLGKPAIAIPGGGPQYNAAFAEAQSRLLGISLTLVNQPSQVLPAMQSLLKNPDLLHDIAKNGLQRMGLAGAAQRIAECLQERLVN